MHYEKKNSLIKLMVSYDLPRSIVTNQITFDQQDSNSVPNFERATDPSCQTLVSNLETLDTITFILLKKGNKETVSKC